MSGLSGNLICVTRPRMGRKMRYPDKIVAPLPAGSLARIAAALKPGEDKTDLLREAVEAELLKRERETGKR